MKKDLAPPACTRRPKPFTESAAESAESHTSAGPLTVCTNFDVSLSAMESPESEKRQRHEVRRAASFCRIIPFTAMTFQLIQGTFCMPVGKRVSASGLGEGYFSVCKTVYTSSILVVASINIINILLRLFDRPSEVPRAAVSRRRTSLREMG